MLIVKPFTPLLSLHLMKHISLSVSPVLLIIVTFLFRVVVMEVAVRPEMASAGLCGATVCWDWILTFICPCCMGLWSVKQVFHSCKRSCNNGWKTLFSFLRLSWQILLWKAELWGHGERKLWPRLRRSGMGAVQQAVSKHCDLIKLNFESTSTTFYFKKTLELMENAAENTWIHAFLTSSLVSIRDVLCGLLLCTNLTAKPRFGELQGKLTSLTIHHQNRYMDCRWGSYRRTDGYRRLLNHAWIHCLWERWQN